VCAGDHIGFNYDCFKYQHSIPTKLTKIDFSRNNSLVTVSPATPLDTLATLLAKNHRVVVLENEKLVGYITQSALVEFLASKGIFGDQALAVRLLLALFLD
jgi:CBS domain-containing protein